MGERGPAPKRKDQRLGHVAKGDADGVVKAPAGEVVVPDADPDWHDIARRWFEALKLSGQSGFYTSSDWSTAYATAESMSREFKPQPFVIGKGEHAETVMVELPPKAASLMAWLKAASMLLACEGDRRRVGLELQREPVDEEGGDVSRIDDARLRLTGSG